MAVECADAQAFGDSVGGSVYWSLAKLRNDARSFVEYLRVISQDSVQFVEHFLRRTIWQCLGFGFSLQHAFFESERKAILSHGADRLIDHIRYGAPLRDGVAAKLAGKPPANP